jgi:hypothetical protein
MPSNSSRCLVYRATLIPVLETETYVPPLDLHLDEKLARLRSRHKQSGMEDLVTTTCSNYYYIQKRLKYSGHGEVTRERKGKGVHNRLKYGFNMGDKGRSFH